MKKESKLSYQQLTGVVIAFLTIAGIICGMGAWAGTVESKGQKNSEDINTLTQKLDTIINISNESRERIIKIETLLDK
jgi:tagatose-1,6-bisphosphate aldolase